MTTMRIARTIFAFQWINARTIFAAVMTMGLVACGPSPENDPVFLALKANPPTEIPARHLPKLRESRSSCDVFNEGQPSEYMTCWLPVGFTEPLVARLRYFGPGLIRPNREMLGESGGALIAGPLPVR